MFLGAVQPRVNTAVVFLGAVQPRVNTAVVFLGTVQPRVNTAVVFLGAVQPRVNTAVVFLSCLAPQTHHCYPSTPHSSQYVVPHCNTKFRGRNCVHERVHAGRRQMRSAKMPLLGVN